MWNPTDEEMTIVKNVRLDPQWAIAYAILKLSHAVLDCAVQLKYLGNGNAATEMGAIEALSANLGEKLHELTNVVGDVAEAVDRVKS